jgi:O-acetyl-ADP-ribose deacetylase (regulator of RNase III)
MRDRAVVDVAERNSQGGAELWSTGSGRAHVIAFVTNRPWELDIDALVVSVGADGLGRLAAAVQGALPQLDLEQIDLASVVPDRPMELDLGPPTSSHLRWLILASVGEVATAKGPPRPAMLRAIEIAIKASLSAADARGARRIGLPLLGTGVVGLTPRPVARVTVQAVRTWLETRKSRVESVVMFDREPAIIETLTAEWRESEPQTAQRVPNLPSLPLRPAAREILLLALSIADARGGGDATGLDVLLACLVQPEHTKLDKGELALGATAAVVRAVPESADERVAAALSAVGIDRSKVDLSGRGSIDDPRLRPIVSAAAEVASVVGATEIWSHHVAAAAIVSRPPLPRPVLGALGVDEARLRAALRDAIQQQWPDESAAPWDSVLGPVSRGTGSTEFEIATSAPPSMRSSETAAALVRDYMAGYANDAVVGEDLLGISNEVEALATLLASRALEPPLALGLFGDWGTGKTFFMTKLQDRIRNKALFERHKSEPRTKTSYCESIVQINFNAWHYVDKELWASLANAIFEGLDEAVTTKDLTAAGLETRAQKRLRLLAEQDANRRSLEDAKVAQAEAQAAVEAASARLVALDSADDELAQSVGIGDIVAGVYRVATAVPEIGAQADAIVKQVDKKINEAANALRVPAKDLRAELAAGPRGRLRVGWALVLRRPAMRLFALIAVVSLMVVGLWLWAAVGQPFLGVLAAVTSVAAVVGAAWRAATPAIRILADARREARQLIEAKRNDAKVAVEKRRRDAKQIADNVQPEIADRLTRDAELKEQLEETEPGQAMAKFIRMRRASNAYTSRLGVVAQARDDFEQLTAYLAAETTEGPVIDQTTRARLVPPVDRIMLYIDDLDRCTEKQVVDVLQAVHLLLAFKLFVVVVAVDPRWLLHSLRVQSRALDQRQDAERAAASPSSDETDTGAEWEATPMDYLEKIFQVPFALWPMDSVGFGRLITDLSKDGPAEAVAEVDGGGNGTNVAHDLGDGGTGSTPGGGERRVEPSAVPGDGGGTEVVEEPEVHVEIAATHEVDPEVLRISAAERRFMKLMHPLIVTPRSAKRFVNVYRLLKASKAREGGIDFEDERVHRPVLLLLALTTGFPDLAAPILEALYSARAASSPIWDIVESAKQDLRSHAGDARAVEQWSDLQGRLGQVSELLAQTDVDRTPPPPALDGQLLGEWALAAARYSFEASRVLLQYRATDSASNGSAEPVALAAT